MSNGYREFISDQASIGRDASNRTDRRQALDWCLTHNWVNSDIGVLERVDEDNRHGWGMNVKT
jgi:hypothetical protein